MKAALYAVESHAHWNWYCTLDPGIDRFMRFRLYDAATRIIWFGPSLSFGQAIWLADKLNERVIAVNTHPDLLRRELISAGAGLALGRELFQNARLHIYSAGSLVLDMLPFSETCFGLFLSRLEGKALLPEEMQSILDTIEHGQGDMRSLWTSYAQAAVVSGAAVLTNGIGLSYRRRLLRRQPVWTCKRCGSEGARIVWAPCLHCGGLCPYCESCLTMGRSRFCTPLLLKGGKTEREEKREPYQRQERIDLGKWGLSPAQTEASVAGIRFLDSTKKSAAPEEERIQRQRSGQKEPPCFLIWAVTGAGKTEMIFPLIEHELSRGGKVLVTTPRRDVVLELKPRLQKAFPGHRLVTLYGGSDDRWEQGDFFLTTTHQLFRFWRAFDLVIIDELDAFPFHNSPTLEYAARKACKEDGRYILLSATPPGPLQQQVKRRKLPHVRVPVRFHRHPLPVPNLLRIKRLEAFLRTGVLPRNLREAIESSLERGAQLFLFVSKIKLIEPLISLLRTTFPQAVVEGTSSQDENRADKVLDFRGKQTNILVTTTILERGVTVPKTDVFILDADSPLFDEASLVQMAGRAGRSKDDPSGRVYFAAPEITRAQLSAIGQIRQMNRIAGKKGFLLEQRRGSP